MTRARLPRGALFALALLSSPAFCHAATVLSNPSFELGEQAPIGWLLEGKGAWEQASHSGQRAVSVTGSGSDSGFWRTSGLALEPNALYRVAFWVKGEGATGGCVVSGPSFCNRDFRASPNWERHAFCFVAPADPRDAFLRFGHWQVKGKLLFDDIALEPTQAVHERFGDIVLGEGEEIAGSRYTFAAPLRGEGANHARPLAAFNCHFNSDRWCLGSGSEVVYRHAIPGREQNAAAIEANCSYHTGGVAVIEVDHGAGVWIPLARIGKVGRVKADVPRELLPAQTLLVRLRGEQGANLQINEYVYTATLDADLGDLRGSTAYLDVQAADPAFPVTVISVPSTPGGPQSWTLSVGRLTGQMPKLDATATVKAENGDEQTTASTAAASELSAPSPPLRPGANTLTLSLRAEGKEVYRASVLRRLAVLHDAAYGYRLPSDAACPLWWCEGPYKVSRTRPAPTAQRATIEVAAARHEHEPFQLVLRPKAELKNLRVQVSPLKSGGATLAPEHIRVEQVAYLNVVRPTDAAGVRGWWPDPLPPFEQGTNLAADRNHPLWFTVYVPPDQPAGDYAGAIELSADGWKATVPLKLRVYDFALPRSTRLQTAFGLDHNVIRRYHNLETTEELRKVLDLYLANFAAHRIAPYNPAPLDPFKVQFSTAGELKATLDFAAFDRECDKWLAEGGFNAIMVGLKGMGGGTFHSRHPGRIGGFVQGTPEYDKLMASQGRQLVEHLKAKGWLDKAYIYWFDEPDPKDYPFVIEGMQLIKRAAPGLTRMLTEQPEPALYGHVDLWCPVVSAVKPEAIAERRKAGERFWWYLCCGPHAPYIGLFIDHPAADLRVWAWLSRKWGVTGQLVWTSNYWTSSAAFPPPDIQDPWADPMSYCSGYDFTPGKIGYWGNGDGRFLYPPNRNPKTDKAKHLTGPINSIRWEMLRDGVEDYELFALLDHLTAAAKKAGKAAEVLPEAERLAFVPDEVIKDDKTYSKDPQPLLAHRRRLAETVERLSKAQR